MGLFDFFNNKTTPPDNTEKKIPLNLVEGDIFFTKHGEKFNVYKLLVDEKEIECYHVLMYASVDNLPTIEDLEALTVLVYHSPINSNAFTDATLLTNKTVSSKDLIGYHEYLRQTRDVKYYVEIAKKYFKNAYFLSQDKKHYEAIDEYSKAIDLFPQFYEAIDNRAFSKMDLQLWAEAIEDFKYSLLQNANNFLAEHWTGRCYLHLNDLVSAKTHLVRAQVIDPTHPDPPLYISRIDEVMSKMNI